MFTIEEISLIKMYSGIKPNKNNILNKLKTALPEIEEPEMKKVTEETIRKLTAMNQTNFDLVDLTEALPIEEEI